MKKLMFIAAFAVIGLSNVNAQNDITVYGFEEGDVLLEGSLNLRNTNDKNTDTKTNSFTITPKVGYFINDDLALGLSVGYGSDKKEIINTTVSDESSIGAGVFARYYFWELGQRLKTYSELNVGFGSSKDKISDVKASGVNAGINLGLNYFVTENIAISFGLSDILAYNSSKVKGAKAESEVVANINVFDNIFTTAQFGLTFKL